MNNLQAIADYLNNSGTGVIAQVYGNHVVAQVPGQLNGKPAMFPETVYTMGKARRIVADME